jgi:hypothetical protein
VWGTYVGFIVWIVAIPPDEDVERDEVVSAL